MVFTLLFLGEDKAQTYPYFILKPKQNHFYFYSLKQVINKLHVLKSLHFINYIRFYLFQVTVAGFKLRNLTLSLTGIARPWLLRGGADSAPRKNSMKERSETQCYYLEDGHLLKLSSHTKIWIPISQIERDFEI